MTTTILADRPAHSPAAPTVPFWQWLRGAVPTAAVVAVLSALAIFGHLTDWTMPKFSSLIGAKAVEEAPWCMEHNVLEAEDIECNASLLPRGPDYGWCKVHGVHQCPLEHPDVAQLKTPPIVTQEFLDRAARGLALRPRPENNSLCTLHQRRIQFASTKSVEKVGVDISVVKEHPLVESIHANGELVYDQTRLAPLPSRVAGAVYRVEKQVGNAVRKGDVLALIDAADVGRAKSELLQAIAQLRLRQATVERLRPLAEREILSGRQLKEAEAAFQEARIRLQGAEQALANLDLAVHPEDFAEMPADEIWRAIQYLGLPTDIVATLDPRAATSNLFPLRAPFDGVIVSRSVMQGVVVDTSAVLFGVADVSRMWLMLNVRQEDAKYVSLKQTALFRPSDIKDEPEIGGLVSWISTSADEQTRMVQVRVDLLNKDENLRANTFGAGQIVLRREAKAVFVPNEAVHWDGNCHVVFVRDKNYLQPDAPKFFHVRSVRLGVKDGDQTEIIAGLLPGEVIASKNSVVLESQLLKSNLGAGCGCADGH